MRIFLIVISFINIVLYYMMYALFDSIVELLDWTNLSPGFLNFTKLSILVTLGFLIGLLVILVLDVGRSRSYFDIRTLAMIGFIPAIGLLLSGGTITNFFITRFFDSNKQLSELCYYLFSRTIVWSLWLGFSIGVSVRLKFREEFKHRVSQQAVIDEFEDISPSGSSDYSDPERF
ncbi:MAG: hypothetical protein H5T85_05355 [Actinobacteria bacterium]|nr:hypothetical protein [Actinomycetota bacterium]